MPLGVQGDAHIARSTCTLIVPQISRRGKTEFIETGCGVNNTGKPHQRPSILVVEPPR